MSELISLFQKLSAEPAAPEKAGSQAAKQPEYFVQLLKYLREIKREQAEAFRAAITALAEAD